MAPDESLWVFWNVFLYPLPPLPDFYHQSTECNLDFPFLILSYKRFPSQGESLSLDDPVGRNLDPHFREHCLNSSTGDSHNAVVIPETRQDDLA